MKTNEYAVVSRSSFNHNSRIMENCFVFIHNNSVSKSWDWDISVTVTGLWAGFLGLDLWPRHRFFLSQTHPYQLWGSASDQVGTRSSLLDVKWWNVKGTTHLLLVPRLKMC